nr:unnamed protein product [Spirometra erinaceieuropaei]
MRFCAVFSSTSSSRCLWHHPGEQLQSVYSGERLIQMCNEDNFRSLSLLSEPVSRLEWGMGAVAVMVD